MVGITQNWRISARGDITPCLTLLVPLQIGVHQAAPLPELLQVGATDLLEDFAEEVLGAEAELTSTCQPSSCCLSRWPWAHAVSSTLRKLPLQQGLLDQPTSQVFGEVSLPNDLWLSQHDVRARREQDLWKLSSAQIGTWALRSGWRPTHGSVEGASGLSDLHGSLPTEPLCAVLSYKKAS